MFVALSSGMSNANDTNHTSTILYPVSLPFTALEINLFITDPELRIELEAHLDRLIRRNY